jgi:hypothetical protein
MKIIIIIIFYFTLQIKFMVFSTVIIFFFKFINNYINNNENNKILRSNNHTRSKRHWSSNQIRSKRHGSNILGLTSMLNPCQPQATWVQHLGSNKHVEPMLRGLQKLQWTNFEFFFFGFHYRCLGFVFIPLHLKTFLSILLLVVCVNFSLHY